MGVTHPRSNTDHDCASDKLFIIEDLFFFAISSGMLNSGFFLEKNTSKSILITYLGQPSKVLKYILL